MREILFKGKRVDNGEWVEGFYVNVPEHYKQEMSGKSYIVSINNGLFMEVVPETVGQYTGLTDKNGKKIFEGDIVKFYDTIHKVVFEAMNGTAYFGIKISDTETWGFGNYVEVYKLEVIGNIHDNPELLQEDKQ